MAATSIPHRWKYDVFVSFRGEDIRKNFMDHMFSDFKQKGIHAFRDDRELPKGEYVSPHLYKAIEESRFLIVIFSKNYAVNRYEYKFIDCISKDILKKLCDGPLHVGENLVGIDFHFEQLDLSHYVGSDKVNMIGICGISGIGKTTLAKAIHNLMYIHFEGSCFCEDVEEVTKRQGLIQVQRHMVGKIMKIEDLKIPSVGEGIMVIKKMMSSRPILLVLDDVDDHEQLEALAGSPTWFCRGSLIIFTGKDKQLLRSHRVDGIYDMKFLDNDKSVELFYSFAFEEKYPSTGFKEVSEKVVKFVQGHPLALNVLGRFLYGKSVRHWESECTKV